MDELSEQFNADLDNCFRRFLKEHDISCLNLAKVLYLHARTLHNFIAMIKKTAEKEELLSKHEIFEEPFNLYLGIAGEVTEMLKDYKQYSSESNPLYE